MQDVAVVIINYNTSKYTVQCVNSVLEKTDPSIDVNIVVVDNASQKKDFDFLKNNLPTAQNVNLVKSNVNTGFGGGNMLGFRHTNAKYVLFLNNDAFLENDCLRILYDFMNTHPEAALATAQNFDEQGNFVISFDHNKGLRKMVFGRSFLEKRDPEKYPARKKEYTEPVKVNWVNGAFMFFRSEDFIKAGGFDTHIFLYFEEMDICHRLAENHKKTYLVPEARITHYQGKSTGENYRLHQEALISFLYMIRKNFGYSKYVLTKTYLLSTFIVRPEQWKFYKVLLSSKPEKYSLRPSDITNVTSDNKN